MYKKPRVNVKVEPRSTFTLTSDLPYIVSNLFTHVKPVRPSKIYKSLLGSKGLKGSIIKIGLKMTDGLNCNVAKPAN